MYISALSLFNYKSHAEGQYRFVPGINAITGPNGSGKTNIADAIHFLANGKSYFNALDNQLIRFENGFFTLKGVFHLPAETEIIAHFAKGGKKTFRKNGKLYDRLVDHVGTIFTVFISPNDISLVYGIADDRRRFTDQVMSNVNREFLLKLVEYRKLLDQRNAMLKMYSGRTLEPEVAESIDLRLAPVGQEIHRIRKAFLEAFLPHFQRVYSRLSAPGEVAGIEYRSDVAETDMATLLKANFGKDRVLERTSGGVHRDDWEFTLNGHPLKRFASQGQIKTFVIALKLAQFLYFRSVTGKMPILLLDDIFEKIDESRSSSLMSLVTELDFGQIIITDTHWERVESHLEQLPGEKHHIRLDAESSGED